MEDRREQSWDELKNAEDCGQRTVYEPNDERMEQSKILGILEEFPFLKGLIGNLFDLFEIFVERIDEAVLARQAIGHRARHWMFMRLGMDQQMSFVAFDDRGNKLIESAPTKGWKFYLLEGDYRIQPPLGQVLGGLDYSYVVEIFKEEGVVRRMTVYKAKTA